MTQQQRPGINWAPRPKAGGKVFYPLVTPRPRQTIHVIITSHELVGVMTHWMGGRTVPCGWPDGQCEGCERRISQRWKGYLGCVKLDNGQQCLVEITRGAYEACPKLLEGKQGLRGLMAKVYRRGDSRQSPSFIELVPAPKEAVLPPPLNLQDALQRIWGIDPEGHQPEY